MAPNGELLANVPFSRPNGLSIIPKPDNNLQRAISDLSFQISKESIDLELEPRTNETLTLPPISEVEDAKCECCGMSEECTPEYIIDVRKKFFGKWICGLCSEAVKEETEKNGGKLKEAVETHMNACVRFNKFGRTKPVLYTAEAMREMLRRSSSRGKSISPKGGGKKGGGIARSSSCIPAITKEIADARL